MLSPTNIEAYFRGAAARLYVTLDVPPLYLVLHPTDPAPWFNYARPLEPIADLAKQLAGSGTAETSSFPALRRAIADVRSAFAGRGLAPRFEFVEEYAPALAPVLRSEGYVEQGRMLLLTCAPDTLSDVHDVHGLRITAVTAEASNQDLRTLMAVQQQGFSDGDADPVTEANAEQFRQGLRAGNHACLATLDGVPAGVAGFTVPVDGLTELVGITTLQAFRRQGIGAALTASVARAAFDRGVKVAFLVAENARAAGVYRRAGFRAYATALAYGEA